MSKLVNWGHWAAGGFFAFVGADLLWSSLGKIPSMLRNRPKEITYLLFSDAYMVVPFLVCAWGILKWRPWARTLGKVLCILSLPMLGFLLLFDLHHSGPYWGELLALTLVNCLVFVWLLLPILKAQYSRTEQIA